MEKTIRIFDCINSYLQRLLHSSHSKPYKPKAKNPKYTLLTSSKFFRASLPMIIKKRASGFLENRNENTVSICGVMTLICYSEPYCDSLTHDIVSSP